MSTEPTNPPNGPDPLKADTNGTKQELSAPATILLVSPLKEDHVCLQRLCERTCWKTCEAYTCREAVRVIEDEQPDAVLCEANLPDGDWKDLLEELFRRSPRPNMIVTSHFADDAMWAEVLIWGDLVKPQVEPG
jgi:DNA-binding NtrC family response regulator